SYARDVTELVLLTIAPDEFAADTVISLLQTEGIEAIQERTDLAAGMADASASAFGPREGLVRPEDLARARALIDTCEAHAMSRGAYVLNLGQVPYLEAWDLQRSLSAAVSQGAIPDTVMFLEHPPVITLGGRTEAGELHVPEGAEVEIVETDRGGKSTYHGPGQLVCYPILDLTRHRPDVKRYCPDLGEALPRSDPSVRLRATLIEGLTWIWVDGPIPQKVASIGVHITKWITTHCYALNVDLDTAPFTEWITACGLADASFTTIARELGHPVAVEEVRPHAAAAFEEVFDLSLEELPVDEGAGL